VVSNFVSGIILLAERPLRVGDIIEVKGSSGYVRRISVRATEIETADRANVIIPNSELISNVLTNWTHANTLGRIKLKVGVSYDSDPHKVRQILLDAAAAHPQVMKAPAPAVLLLGFGNYALEFELLCIVGNVDISGTVKSDIYFSILNEFRTAKIEIPLPQQEYRIRGGDTQDWISPPENRKTERKS
jgi:small-conductance mechanosensitive channel